ncbi:chemotaxis protein CheB [Terrimonas sp. NA20]|uniref:protein-glutamate methylesterase n=1 Tax=Terrimonas ginsenosidimutans TaxID=2908004 RepID=A0ABS9KXQ9_9BACT|nr:chemotaxis protein CheB [Terrimonas ginsenosidimutans]MCG2617174.1 chemotaxis protein CheB [Terrimonas ginsenosidimutans]
MIIIGGSAGSLQVVFYLLGNCPPDFDIPILIVLHRDPQGISRLAELLATKTTLTVKEIEDKEPIEKGCVYVCPPDYHTLFEDESSFSLDYSEKINFSRPSIDVTFRSGADVFGNRLVCILLSGANADGADGLNYVRSHSGISVVHSPEEAEVRYMPEQALLQGKADHVLRKDEIMQFILRLA